MTDVWRSVGKKYCEICKCWYYNNAISSNRHHMGGRHKASVAKKLRELGQKSREMSLAEKQQRSMLLQMEVGARAAMKADETAATSKRTPVQRGYGAQTPNYGSSCATTFSRESRANDTGNFAIWFEAATPEGQIYYWNCITHKTSWKAPKEGYVTISAQLQQTANRRSKTTTSRTDMAPAASSLPVVSPSLPCIPSPPPIGPFVNVPLETSQVEVDTTSSISVVAPTSVPSLPDEPKCKVEEKPVPLGHPYGPWQTVEITDKKEATSQETTETAQSWQQDHDEDETDEDLQFNEKKVKLQSKTGEGVVEFKKRKATCASRRRRTKFDD
ncbi:WW domain protein [Trichuris suis]|nr:WW domain protein [Trichuris suis]